MIFHLRVEGTYVNADPKADNDDATAEKKWQPTEILIRSADGAEGQNVRIRMDDKGKLTAFENDARETDGVSVDTDEDKAPKDVKEALFQAFNVLGILPA